jgi:quercetin 2,3-dioxygenase
MIRTIQRTFPAVRTIEGGGFVVHRPFPTRMLMDFDPFLLLDEMGPVDYAPGEAVGAPDHPHRGFETVTYMLAGRMRHGDNKGNTGDLGPGSVQWMTAGSGLIHSEMPQQEEGLMWGFQLWVNLPAADKMTAPRYQDIPPSEIPVVQPAAGVTVKVVAGELAGAKGPVSGIATDPVYLDIALEPGAAFELPLPDGHSAFAYVFEGPSADVAGQSLARGELGVLSKGETVAFAAREAARVLLVAGKPLAEPVARYGPFVMNSPDQIHQAIADFRAGKF